ncbi:MAG: sulfotransferase [Pseudomonadota bacterium]
MPADPVYIIGTERSGSNLLRLVLNAHSRIALPHPLHLMRYFAPMEAAYGDLGVAANFARLVDDVLLLERVHIHPWEVPIDRARLIAEARPRDAMGLLGALYEQVMEAEGKARWGCKSTFMVHYTERALARDPGARFVLLVRDPRDVAASSRKSVFSPFHPWITAGLWSEQQDLGLALADRLGEDAVHVLRYEDLLDDPAGRVASLCAFLEEPYEETMLRFHETADARASARLSESWQNTARPVLGQNAGKYRKDLTRAEIALVEAEAGPLMDRLGYPRDIPEAELPSPSAADRARFRAADLRWRLQVEARSLRHDKNHWRRWARDASMRYLRLRNRLRPLGA